MLIDAPSKVCASVGDHQRARRLPSATPRYELHPAECSGYIRGKYKTSSPPMNQSVSPNTAHQTSS
ncbi:hypothetical protein cgR_5019 [Corynebacterium glutamicum R]|uniref:Uncharacterized protein n=1 Tax=Corynebacterium glutamicum (strain R) TaxID=340322 RepID=A0AB72VAI7_CORGB|nr:hypothetical protein cgR_5019 [Corynebacterium glutamicum R]